MEIARHQGTEMTTDKLETSGLIFPTSCDVPHMEVEGMTLRDYFAAKTMAAIVASPDYVEGAWFQEEIALQAYTMADAMLAARGVKE